MVDGVVFAAGDALGAVAGVAQLQALGLPVLAVSGVLTASPLAVQEVRSVLDVPVWRRDELSDPVVAAALVQGTPFPLALSA